MVAIIVVRRFANDSKGRQAKDEQYFARVQNKLRLLGDGPEQEAQVLQYLSWANAELLMTLAGWFLPLIPGFSRPAPFNEAVIVDSKQRSLKMLDALEKLLDGRNWVVGSRMTLADVAIAVFVSRGLEWVLGSAWRNAHPNIMKHFNSVVSLEAVRKVVPKFILIEEETPLKDPYKGKA